LKAGVVVYSVGCWDTKHGTANWDIYYYFS